MPRLVCCLALCLLLSCAAAPEPTHIDLPVPGEQPAGGEQQPVSPPGGLGGKLAPQSPPGEIEQLIRTDPVRFLQRGLQKYCREVRSYRATLVKQERVAGTLYPPEKVRISFQEKPFSVRMDWVEGIRLARRTAFVAGENGGKLLALGAGWRAIAGVLERDPLHSDATSTSRFPITEFGIKIGTERTLDAMKRARMQGHLDVRFLGLVSEPELNGKPCWKVKRVGYPKPEDDGITESTFWFDRDSLLQVGSYLTGEKGQLIAYYYFRDLELNPTLPANTFTREGLRK